MREEFSVGALKDGVAEMLIDLEVALDEDLGHRRGEKVEVVRQFYIAIFVIDLEIHKFGITWKGTKKNQR